MGRTHRLFRTGLIVMLGVAGVIAEPQTGTLIEVETGTRSEAAILTNGAEFKLGEKTYRLEIAATESETLEQRLSKKGAPLQLNEVTAKDAFSILTQLSGAPVVCAPGVDKTLKVSISTQDASVMSVIEQICFQIGATSTFRDGSFWVSVLKDS